MGGADIVDPQGIEQIIVKSQGIVDQKKVKPVVAMLPLLFERELSKLAPKANVSLPKTEWSKLVLIVAYPSVVQT